MCLVIVSSLEDPAGTNIKKHLLKLSNWEEGEEFKGNPVLWSTQVRDTLLVTIEDRTIFHEHLDKEIEVEIGVKPKQMIYISRHTSQTGEPTLTTHPVGNYGVAEYGGETGKLCPSSPRLMTTLLRILKKKAVESNLYHKVCFEVTHHGPILDTPVLYVEVGSNEEEWLKEKPSEVVATSVLELINTARYEEDLPKDIPVLIGIGGGHYAPRFTDVALEKYAAFGHMVPRYQIEAGNFREETLDEILEKTPDIYAGYFHRKSLKKADMRLFKKWFEDRGLPIISSKELRELNEENL